MKNKNKKTSVLMALMIVVVLLCFNNAKAAVTLFELSAPTVTIDEPDAFLMSDTDPELVRVYAITDFGSPYTGFMLSLTTLSTEPVEVGVIYTNLNSLFVLRQNQGSLVTNHVLPTTPFTVQFLELDRGSEAVHMVFQTPTFTGSYQLNSVITGVPETTTFILGILAGIPALLVRKRA